MPFDPPRAKIIHNIENTLICVEMLLMTIAGGCAFSYVDFMGGVPKEGKFTSVIKDIWKTFKRDFRLIKPKKFGF